MPTVMPPSTPKEEKHPVLALDTFTHNTKTDSLPMHIQTSTTPAQDERGRSANVVVVCAKDGQGGDGPETPSSSKTAGSRDRSPRSAPSTAAGSSSADGCTTTTTTTPGEGPGLQRRLRSKHMQMIAIGGNIGTGIFIASGHSLYDGGPAFVLIDFLLVAVMVYCVVNALAEMTTLYPVSGSFVTYASRFIEPAFGFALGFNYWLQWLIAMPIQTVVAIMLIAKWDTAGVVPAGVWIVLFLGVVGVVNVLGVEKFGQVELGLSMTKIVAIALFFIIAIVVDLGGGPGNHFRGAHTFYDPGAFKNGLRGFCSVFVTAAFTYGGTELIGLTAGETVNPRKEVPKATNSVFWTIALCNVLSVLMIGLIIPSTDPRLSDTHASPSSPFVLVAEAGGMPTLGHIYNAFILGAVLSVGISCVYPATRTVVSLAQNGQAPRILGKIDGRGRPLPAVAVSLAFGFLAFAQYASNAAEIFHWLMGLSGLATFISWGTICFSHCRFRMAWERQGHSLEELPWRSPVGVWGSVVGTCMSVAVIVCSFFIAASPIDESLSRAARAGAFFQAFLAAPIMILFYAIGRIILPNSVVLKLKDIDLQTGRRTFAPMDQVQVDGGAAAESTDCDPPTTPMNESPAMNGTALRTAAS
ncbi:hypothetical protein V8E36_001588 [Tilletia maclaganii]